MRPRPIVSLLLAFVLSAAAVAARQAAPAAPADLDAYIARVMTTVNVPGLGLAMV